MTEIERKALAWVNEVEENRGWARSVTVDRHFSSLSEALCRAIERIEELEATERDYAKPLMELQEKHEAFRREVSDAVEAWRDADVMSKVSAAAAKLHSFIIPKPVDPLVEALNEIFGKPMPRCEAATERKAADLRAALAARGLEVRKIGEGE